MVASSSLSPMDLVTGAVLQCVEAATLGMPFEVWKTRMGRHREETTLQSFRELYKRGIWVFWQGLGPKMVESATKGGILLFSKESILNSMIAMGTGNTLAGFVAGAGGGICQTVVMGPCTFLVTAMVTCTKQQGSAMDKMRETIAAKGIKGLYAGGTAIAFRQASNWASRQGFTEFCRNLIRGKNEKLTKGQEVLAGVMGGTMACWNHPFEVARIEMQARAHHGETHLSLPKCISHIYKEQGMQALFQGLVPRVCLGIWQTLFMVTAAKMVREKMKKYN